MHCHLVTVEVGIKCRTNEGMQLDRHSVSRFAVTTADKKQIKAELKELPEEMQAANFSNQTQKK